jgi:hypothetical protein
MGLRVEALAVAMFAVVAFCSPPIFAGVVVTEVKTIGPAQAPHAEQFTLIVHGRKEKIVGDNQAIVTDLEAKVFYLIYPTPMVLTQLPFPGDPPTLATVAGTPLDADYQKTGHSRTIAGYSCDEYAATVNNLYTVTTVLSCFATNVPGAPEFSEFRRDLLNKLGASGAKISASLPEGILMAQETSTRLEEHKLNQLNPAIARRLRRQAMRTASQVNKIEVKKIEVKDIPGNAFQLPWGYSESAQ